MSNYEVQVLVDIEKSVGCGAALKEKWGDNDLLKF